MAIQTTPQSNLEQYAENEGGFRDYLHDVADDVFVFPDYREYQDEILYLTLEAFFIDGYDNVIVEGPTGIGKSPLNVAFAQVLSIIEGDRRNLEQHFNVKLDGLTHDGKSFYTTPQKQLRNQLANDDDLQEQLSMLKSRQDYVCGATGQSCDDCAISKDPDQSCMEQPDCTYWNNKNRAMNDDIAVITFAMEIVDNYLPTYIEDRQLSFDNRDGEIVDEGHGLESQAASLFAGFTVSPWSLPSDIYGDAGDRVGWDVERFEDVENVLEDLYRKSTNFIKKYDELPEYEDDVELCESFVRKYEYCLSEIEEGRPWVANTDSVEHPDRNRKTKKIELKPVDVDRFLNKYIWSRANKRLITSATIPYRDNVGRWADRIGLPGRTKFISRPMPFPVKNRLVHTNTIVGSMSGDDEEKNWDDVVEQVKKIYSHHQGEKGLIHTASYKRMNKLAEALPESAVMTQDRDQDKEQLIEEWIASDKDILLSPSMTEGVDLHGDRCRWQVMLKCPYPFVGDNRVSYLLNERHDWDWYMETTMLDVIQSVGRAVRGPEDSEAASYYVIDQAFQKLLARTSPPSWFLDAITDDPPEHWEDSTTAPWR